MSIVYGDYSPKVTFQCYKWWRSFRIEATALEVKFHGGPTSKKNKMISIQQDVSTSRNSTKFHIKLNQFQNQDATLACSCEFNSSTPSRALRNSAHSANSAPALPPVSSSTGTRSSSVALTDASTASGASGALGAFGASSVSASKTLDTATAIRNLAPFFIMAWGPPAFSNISCLPAMTTSAMSNAKKKGRNVIKNVEKRKHCHASKNSRSTNAKQPQSFLIVSPFGHCLACLLCHAATKQAWTGCNEWNVSEKKYLPNFKDLFFSLSWLKCIGKKMSNVYQISSYFIMIGCQAAFSDVTPDHIGSTWVRIAPKHHQRNLAHLPTVVPTNDWPKQMDSKLVSTN